MDFSIPPAFQSTLDAIDRLLVEHVIPAEREVHDRGFTASTAMLDGLRAKVKAAGLWAPQLPADIGGMGLGLVEHGLVSERLGRSPIGHFVFGCQAPDAGNIEILHKYGTPEQKTKWLMPLARGETRSCFSMTEPENPGSNPTLLSCRAQLDGDHYVVDGHKWFTSSADGAAFAIVMAVTEPDAPPHQRASMIIVPTDTPGFNLVRNVGVMGHAGSGHASHAEVIYQSCRVPRSNLLGPEGSGFVIAQERLGPGRIHHCMRWLGIAQRAFEMMCARANERVIDTDGGTLADKQVIQHWAAELDAEIRGARLQVLHAAWTIDELGASAA